MFSKIREILSTFSKKVAEVVSTKELSEEDFESIFSDIELALIEGDVALEAIDILKEKLKEKLIGIKVSRLRKKAHEQVIGLIKEAINDLLSKGIYGKEITDLVSSGPKPYVIVFMGVNGVGKTTTIAKIAYRLLKAVLSQS